MSDDTKPLLDIPSENPGLGFNEYAIKLSDTIKKVPEGQLTVGILGDYGTGKTTLMKAIQKELEQEDSILPIWFPAWRYDQAEEPLAMPLLHSIKKAVDKAGIGADTGSTFKAAIKSLIRSTTFTIKTPIVEMKFDAEKTCTEEEKYLEGRLDKLVSDYKDIYESLREFLSVICNSESPIKQLVVFIDDLDRCEPHKAAQMIEATKSFFEIKGLTFVIGLNRKSISKYLKSKFDEDFTNPDEYLQKIIQVPFYVPTPSTEKLKEEVSTLALSHSIEAGELLAILCGYEFGNSPSLTIRDMKQILNSYIHLPYAGKDSNDQIFRLLLMHKLCPYSYSHVKKMMSQYPKLELKKIKPSTEGEESVLIKKEDDRYKPFLDKTYDKLLSGVSADVLEILP